MGISPLTRVSNTIMRRIFGKKRPASSKPTSKSSSTSTTTNTSSSSLPAPPATAPRVDSLPHSDQGHFSHQGAAPPDHAPPNASGYISSATAPRVDSLPHSGQGHFSHQAPPDHAPPNASGYVSSYTIHGGNGGNTYATPVRTNVYGGSALHGSGHGEGFLPSPGMEYTSYTSGSSPAHHINESMGAFGANRQEQLEGTGRSQTAPIVLDSLVHETHEGPGGALDDTHDSDRQLTAEKEEEKDVEAIKPQIDFTKILAVQSTENTLHVTTKAEETSRNVLAPLETQDSSPQNTRKNPALVSSHNQITEEKTHESKTPLSGSVFAIHVKDPPNPTDRAEAEDAKALALNRAEGEGQEESRAKGYQNHNRIDKALDCTPGKTEPPVKQSPAERGKYRFGDESDDEMEQEIEMSLGEIADVTVRLRELALVTKEEVGGHVRLIDVVQMENYQLDDRIVINRNRIQRIY